MNLTNSKERQLVINMIGNIVVFVTNIAISFFLTPYIVKNIGVEANGFVTLANNFISYASIITVALNSMASRFITLKYVEGDYEAANSYYTSVLVGNLIISAALFMPAIFGIIFLDKIIQIPTALIPDVKLLFAFIFANFFISTALPTWSIGFFLKNQLYLQSVGNIITAILRVTLLLTLFAVCDAKVFYVGLAASVVSIANKLWARYYKKKIAPELCLNRRLFDIKKLRELVSSGIWNSITQLGTLLLSGLDLLIANLLLGPIQMGILSVVKVIPNTISSLATTVSNVFYPSIMIEYAKGNSDAIIKELRFGMKITTATLTILLSAVMVWGKEFFTLWQPTQDAQLLQILSILSCLSFIISNSIQVLYCIFSVVNKVKMNSIAVLIGGLISTCITFILLKTTSLGIFAIAATSSVLNVLRHMIYTIPATARYLKLKWSIFYPDVFLSVGMIGVHIVIGFLMKFVITADSWFTLVMYGGIYAVICFFANIFVVLNKQQRKRLLKKVWHRKG